MTIDEGIAATWRNHAGQAIDGGCLAGAIWAQQTKELATWYCKPAAFYGPEVPPAHRLRADFLNILNLGAKGIVWECHMEAIPVAGMTVQSRNAYLGG